MLRYAKYLTTFVLAVVFLAQAYICEDYCQFKYSQEDISFGKCEANHRTGKQLYWKEKYTVLILESESVQFFKDYFESHSDRWILVKKSSDNPDLDLIYSTEGVDWKMLNSHVLFSFWPLQQQFHNKANFYRNAQKLDQLGIIKELSLEDVMPKTYFFDMNQPKFTDEEKEFFRKHKSGVWIKKPVEEARCKGIEIFRDLKEFHSKVGKNKPYKKPSHVVEKKSWIVQKYIENSLLINAKKFDIRSFVLIASFSPYVMLYHPGYIRRSLEEYSLDDLSNKFIHCVNQSVQMKHKRYEQEKADTIWSMEQFTEWLEKKGKTRKDIEDKMMKRIAFSGMYQQSFVSNKSALHERKFQLYGVDISFDDEFNPYIIEWNAHVQLNPSEIQVINVLFQELTASIMEIESQHLLFNQLPSDYFGSEQFESDIENTQFTLLYNQAIEYSIIH